MPHRQAPAGSRRAQRGAATLIVVMVLFFVLAMVAGYTGRNLIFEQRTSANQYRSTMSFEAADAGLEWAIARLNSGRIDANCQPSANVADPSFRERYINISATDGTITVPNAVLGVGGGVYSWPSCVFNGVDWVCSCPALGAAAAVAAPPGAGPFPAFRVRFISMGYPALPPARASVVRIEVRGCTTVDNTCLDFPGPSDSECRGTVCANVALFYGVKTLPEAALTARGNIDLGGAAMSVFNSAPGTSGVTLQAGGAVNRAGLNLHGPPGSPGQRTVVDNDAGLSHVAFNANRMFAAVFGVWRETYWAQPAAVTLPCGVGGCTTLQIRNAALLNPGRVILAQGDVAFDGGGDVGSVADPVVVVASGNVTFSAPTNVFGLVYSGAANWATAGAGQIRGAAVGEGNIGGGWTPTIVYDRAVLERLRWRTGSFVKVPGSWRDFP
jgi:hypothetical protein